MRTPPLRHSPTPERSTQISSSDSKQQSARIGILACTRLFASAAKAHVTIPLMVLFTKPEYLVQRYGGGSEAGGTDNAYAMSSH
jgi:hypothetical protein